MPDGEQVKNSLGTVKIINDPVIADAKPVTVQTNVGRYTAALSPDAITGFFRLQRP